MIAVISDVHFPSNAERQKIMETGLKKLTGIRALFICGDFTDNRKDTKPEEEMKLPEYIKKLPYPVFFIDGNHEDYDVLKRLPKISDSENELLFQKSGCSLTAENTMKAYLLPEMRTCMSNRRIFYAFNWRKYNRTWV